MTAPSPARSRRFTYARAARRGGGARRGAAATTASARATASSSTCRWSPEAAVAMLACARLGAVHSVVFGGFASQGTRHPHRRRAAENGDLGLLRPRARPRRRLQAAARPGDRAGRHNPPAKCLILQREQLRLRPACRAATSTMPSMSAPRAGRERRRSTACRSPPPTRSTSSTRPARPASPRASCATMAATWSR